MFNFLEVSSPDSYVFPIVLLVILFLFIFFCIHMARKTSKMRKKTKADAKKTALIHSNEEARLKAKAEFMPISGNFEHTAGLSLASGIKCQLNLNRESLKITGNGFDYNLSIDKITSMDYKTETNVQTFVNQTSSAGKALAGAMMFGVPGALIGGRTKTTQTTKTTYRLFLVVTYKKDDGIDYLVFEGNSDLEIKKFAEGFYILCGKQNVETINL